MAAQASSRDTDGLRDSLHRLVGAAGSCGFQILSAKADQLEEEVTRNGISLDSIERIKQLSMIREEARASFERIPIQEERGR